MMAVSGSLEIGRWLTGHAKYEGKNEGERAKLEGQMTEKWFFLFDACRRESTEDTSWARCT